MQELKVKTVRGGLARLCAQGANLVLRVATLMVLARLLSPEDFGLVGMVTAVTGVLTWFRDFGLSAATIQHPTVSASQLSTLFWVNIVVGALLTLLVMAIAPAIAAFYHQPHLVGLTLVLALGFLFNAAGVQHSALLQREMRFTTLSAISVLSLTASAGLAIGTGEAGFGYWSLAAMSVSAPLVSSIAFWLTTRWIPGMPRRGSGVRSMMHFGGALTLNGIIAYVAFNSDKVMIGRFWGASAIGIYGRAYQLINIPVDNFNSAVGEVAFAALSRVQGDAVRLRKYFLKGFSFVLGLTLPVTIVCALFANDLVLVVLGPRWASAAAIVRLFSPTIAIFAIINPLGWLIYSLGLVRRGVMIAAVFAPIMITGCLIGLSHGPTGVAFAYSAVMMLWVLPHIAWCVSGTPISFWDILLAVSRPLGSGILAGGLAIAFQQLYGQTLSPFFRLALEATIVFAAFFGILLFLAGQKELYLDLFRGLKGTPVGTAPAPQ